MTLTASDVPVPVKLTVCELPLALSETARVAVRVPVAVGVRVGDNPDELGQVHEILIAQSELPKRVIEAGIEAGADKKKGS